MLNKALSTTAGRAFGYLTIDDERSKINYQTPLWKTKT